MEFVVNSALAYGVDPVFEKEFASFTLQVLKIHSLMNQLHLNLKLISDELMIEQRNKLFKAMQSMFEEYRQREHAANLSTHTSEPSRRFNYICYDDDDYDYEESTIPLHEIISQLPPFIVITTSPLVLPIEDPEVSLLMENKELNTIPKNESGKFINDDESLSDKDVLKDNLKTYSNPLFKFDDEYISSDVNPLFDEVLEDNECKDSYDSNLDKSTFLVIPLFDSDEDEYFTSENDYLFDLESKNDKWKKILYDAPIDDLISEDKVFDPGICVKKISLTYVSLPFEDRPYLFFTYAVRILLLHFTYPVVSPFLLSSGSEDTIFDLNIFAFHFSHRCGTFISFNVYPNILNESPMEICSSTCFNPNIMMIWGRSKGNLFKRVECLRLKLKDVKTAIDDDPQNQSLRITRVKLQEEFYEAEADEEKFLYQQAKIKWLCEGDKNSRFFHRVLKGRKCKSKVHFITNNAGIRHEGDHIPQVVLKHFQEFLGTSYPVKESVETLF
nr:hypothetical protein [Tanacetum cinerariifolium]